MLKLTLEEFENKRMKFIETMMKPYQNIVTISDSAISTWQNIYNNFNWDYLANTTIPPLVSSTISLNNTALVNNQLISSINQIDFYALTQIPDMSYVISQKFPSEVDLSLFNTLNQQWQKVLVDFPQFDLPYIEQLDKLANQIDSCFSYIEPYIEIYSQNHNSNSENSNQNESAQDNQITTTVNTESIKTTNTMSLFDRFLQILSIAITLFSLISNQTPCNEITKLQQQNEQLINYVQELTETIDQFNIDIQQMETEIKFLKENDFNNNQCLQETTET